jgi:uncharacterized protein (DUF2235 family)
MNEHDTNLRDLAAMFAMAGLLMRGREDRLIVDSAFNIADRFMALRQPEVEEGIAAIKPKARAKK